MEQETEPETTGETGGVTDEPSKEERSATSPRTSCVHKTALARKGVVRGRRTVDVSGTPEGNVRSGEEKGGRNRTREKFLVRAGYT